MSPTEFRIAWTRTEQNLQPISLQTLNRFHLDKETTQFLFESGLPADASPFLSFVGDLNNKYSRISLLTECFDILESEYSKFVVIGSDGSGDIIAINTSSFFIEWLDHEDYFSSRFMNSSINQLADYLIHYRDFIVRMNADETLAEEFNTKFTDEEFNILRNRLQSIDPRAVKEGFWKEQLDILLADREG